MNNFLVYKQEILSNLSSLGLILKDCKEIDYGEVLDLVSSEMSLKITLYYNKRNDFKYVINRVLPDDRKETVINALSVAETSFAPLTKNERGGKGGEYQKKPIGDWHYKNDTETQSYAGSDESGKGDYFGPLVVAAFTCQKDQIYKLQMFGVKDSKLLTDEKINMLAEKILLDFQGHYEYIVLKPEKYNELYPKFSAKKPGLNEMLAWMHSKVIGNLHKRHHFSNVIIDKFANEKLIKYYVGKECSVDMKIVTRAESDTMVAVASIIARFLYIKNLKDLSNLYKIQLLKGASGKVKELRNRINPEILPFVCKMHFKN